MSTSGSDSDFDGFTLEEASEAVARSANLVRSVPDESDVDISDDDTECYFDSDRGEDDLSDDDIAAPDNLNAEWTDELSDVNLQQFREECGPTHALPADARPLDYFLLFLPTFFFEMVATETNRYAEQKMADKGNDPRWWPTTLEEIRAFFCVNIMMGIRKLPRISNYWSTDERFADPYISSIVTKTRFTKLTQYLHLRDTSATPGRDDPNYDPLFKVRTLIDLVLPRCKDNYKPGCDLSIDEGMIGFKGRLHFRQYMPAKPTKWGIKVWEICEAASGYCCGFDVYTGKKRDGVRQHGLGYDVVWNLSLPFHNQNRHLYFDRFFTSTTLAEHLTTAGTYMCGTIMANRKGLPVEVKKAKLKRTGELIQMQKGNIMATSYKDKRQITFLSTTSPPGVVENGKPHVNVDYNKHMGGVDRFDQLISYYPVGRSGIKWWRYIMWFIVNLSIVNSWIVYSNSERDPRPSKNYDHLQFRADVAEQLRAGHTSRKHRVGRKSKNADRDIARDVLHLHEVVKVEGRKKICRECSQQKRKTPKGRPIETSFTCNFCSVPLCRIGCFTSYHERNLVNV